MKPLFAYFSASRQELSKVTWPNRRQLVRLTGIVIVFAFVFAAFLGGIDALFALILEKVILKG